MRSRKQKDDAANVLQATCFLRGPRRKQDAHFVILSNNTVSVLIHEGGIAGRDDVVSLHTTKKLVDRFLRKNWVLVPKPRRTEGTIRDDIKAAAAKFFSKPSRREREAKSA